VSEKPNILYIFTDQQSATAMSCAGNTDLKTPNLDRLAARGVRFPRAYSAFPLCTPARAAMFTGRYPHEVGIDENNVPIADDWIPKGLGHIVAAAGYDCVYGGKWHVPEIEIPDEKHGFRKICGFDDLNLAQSCVEFMAEKHEKPFFLVASFDNPHNICEWGRQQNLPWGTIGNEPPLGDMPNLPANFDVPPFEPRCIDEWYRNHPRLMVHREKYTREEWRRFRWGYNRIVEKVDGEIGKILDALDEQRLTDKTIVIFSSDHGDHQGAHRLPQKWTFYEESARVPFIMAGPGIVGPGRTDDTLVNASLDMYATVCDYAGAEGHANPDARSLRALAEDESAALGRDHVCSETNFKNIRVRGRMVRTDRHKYSAFEFGLYRECLADMTADPGEMVNLAIESRYDDVVQEHRDLLRAWCERSSDNFGHHYGHRDIPFQVPGQDSQFDA